MAAGAPQRLRTDGLTNPLGLGSLKPLLSWWPSDDRDAEVPTACEVQVASSIERLEAGDANVWSSGRIQAAASHSIRFSGREPGAGERLFWRVRTIDSDGAASPWSPPAFFEIGLVKPEHWHARWISAGESGSRYTSLPAPLLTRSVELRRPIAQARLTIACLGDCRVWLNGERLDELSSTAPWTDYQHCVGYRTVDVTGRVETGLNRLEVLLGDGRYAGFVAGLRERYGTNPALRLQLELRYPGGDRDWIVSDGEWRWQFSSVTSLHDGEAVDLRRQARRAEDSADGSAPVVIVPSSALADVRMRAAPAPSPAIQQRLPAVSRRSLERTQLFDFGERLLGRASLQVAADALRDGDAVQLTYYDQLDQPAVGCDRFTLAPSEEAWEELTATFARHRFRFVEVSGLNAGQILEATGMTVGLPERNEQELLCDAPALSALVESAERVFGESLQSTIETHDGLGDLAAIALGARGLLATDDAMLALQSAQRSLLDAVASEPFPGRYVPAVPGIGDVGEDVPLASDAIVILPWTLYRCCADIDGLQAAFPAMKRFISALERRYRSGVRSAVKLPAALQSAASRDLIPTALYFYSVALAARVAAVLGDSDAFNAFEALAARVRRSFLSEFVTASGRLIDSSIDACLMVLHVGVVEGDARDRVRAELLALLADRDNRQDANPFESPLACALLLPVLAAFDRLDVAYRLVLSDRARDPIRTDRAALSEDGALVSSLWQIGLMDWVVSCVAGIDLDPELGRRHAGYARARLRPRPPLGLNSLSGPPISRVEASLATVSGRYELGWSLSDDSFEVRALVPPGCTAVLVLPDGAEHALSSGRHVRTLSLVDSVDALPIVTELPGRELG